MRFVLHGFDVYSPEIDERGIDFVLRGGDPPTYWDVQVRSIGTKGYVCFRKDKFRIRENLIVALAVFRELSDPDLFLIRATEWRQPAGVLVEHDYHGLKSRPEYGINLSQRGIQALK